MRFFSGPCAWLIVISAAGSACNRTNDTPPPATDAAAPPVVNITATEYAFEAPDTILAGWNTFHLVNRGDEPHEATILRLAPGRTLPQYIRAYDDAIRTRRPRPDWVRALGGPTAAPHDEGNATLHLEPGTYAWIDLPWHLLDHDQARAFVVRPRTGNTPPPSAPVPTVSLRMFDFGFELSAPIKAGKHLIRIANRGVEPHHALLFKLSPGKTIEQHKAWLSRNMQGEAPSVFVSGTAGHATGAETFLAVDLTPGDYVVVCLVAGRDEVPHFTKGMIQQIGVE